MVQAAKEDTMTPAPRLEVKVVYQRLAPPKNAPARIRAVYAYGCHMLRELFFGRRVTSGSAQQAFAVMEAYKHTSDERMVRNDALMTVDKMELERGAPLDANGNEKWGAAISRFTEFEAQTRHEFEMNSMVPTPTRRDGQCAE
jgi:hypothetical protein